MNKVKALFVGLALLLISLPAVAQSYVPGVPLAPHFYYHNAKGWADDAETERTDIKRYYWDGTGDDGRGLYFDAEDALILVTFDRNGVRIYHELHAYKVQLAFLRQDPNGAFGTCYLYLATAEEARAFRATHKVTILKRTGRNKILRVSQR